MRFICSGTHAGGTIVVAISALVLRHDGTLAQSWLFVGSRRDVAAFVTQVVAHLSGTLHGG